MKLQQSSVRLLFTQAEINWNTLNYFNIQVKHLLLFQFSTPFQTQSMSVISNDSSILDNSRSMGLSVFTKPFIQPNSKYFMSASNMPIAQKHKPNDIINAIYRDKDNNHLRVNLDFQQYLFTKDDIQQHTANMYGMGIVSFVGDKSTGKAFLADSSISQDFGRVARGFSKNQKQIINSCCYQFEGNDGNPVQFFVNRKDTSKDAFMWLYLISSVMVFNVKENESSQFKNFIKNLKSLQKNLVLNDGEISKPKLVVALKNSDGTFLDHEAFNNFLDDVEETQLFDRNIMTLSFPYPGQKGVSQKQIVDVPLASLNPQYIDSVKKLNHIIKSSRPKNIMGNTITPKFLSYILDAVTNELNVKGSDKVQVSKIWDDIVEEYGIGYHNFYLKDFTQRLGKELEDEKPRSTLQLYQLIMRVKRGTDRKASGFQNLDDDPIFQKYKKKVIFDISQKQKMIIETNRRYSETTNQAIAQQIFPSMNGRNYKKKIDDYNKYSQFDHSKADTLVDTFNNYLNGEKPAKVGAVQGSSLVSSRWRRESITDSINGDINAKQNELRILEDKLSRSKLGTSENIDDKRRELERLLRENKEKQEKIKQVEESLTILRSSTSNLLGDRQIDDLEQEVKKLSANIDSKDRENLLLRKQKDDLIRSKIDELNQTLKQQDMIEQKVTYMRTGSCLKKAETGKKNGRCILM